MLLSTNLILDILHQMAVPYYVIEVLKVCSDIAERALPQTTTCHEPYGCGGDCDVDTIFDKEMKSRSWQEKDVGRTKPSLNIPLTGVRELCSCSDGGSWRHIVEFIFSAVAVAS